MAASYASTLEYLYGLLNYEKNSAADYNSRNFHLDRMRSLLDLLGNPHADLQILHVAGTKGKGTVSTLLAACLTACGWRTGLYTSPHLVRLEERFQIDGQLATQQDLVELTARVRLAAQELEKSTRSPPTFFEFTTAIALLHFSIQKVDFAVLEVGLGGRLDSTNVCTPLISVITSISLDHQRQLGDTIAQIAAEKAGIIKRHIPVVSSAMDPAARQVICARSEQLEAPLMLAGRDYAYLWEPLLGTSEFDESGPAASVHYRPTGSRNSHIGDFIVQTSLLGTHQGENIAAVLATLDALSRTAHIASKVDRSHLERAMRSTSVPARLQVITHRPTRIVDTAHNPASIKAGIEALAQHFPGRQVVAVFASSVDKDYRSMLDILIRKCKHVVFTAFLKNPRSADSQQLADTAQALVLDLRLPCEVHCVATPAEAWSVGCQLQSGNDLLYASGSFFLAAELLELLGPTVS